ncbi:MAG: ferredoxin [Longimicrobiales bacterium]|nr:ferredoxin [Longimicrobiales bacterium]
MIGELTVRIDRLLCVGFGDCIERAPEVFEFDEETIAVFTEESTAASRERVLDACDSCPVDALVVFDGDGRQIVP